MIQRIQTLWLLAAALLALLSLKFSFFSGNILVENVKQFQHFTGMSNVFLMLLVVAVAIASLVTIFLYRDRNMQLKIAMAICLVSVLTIVFYFYQIKKFIPSDWTYDLGAIISFLVPVTLFLAIRGIYKDEQLVKSADRLR